MEMRPPRNGLPNINALSPPRDSSATTEMTKQHIRQVQNQNLTNRVQAFSTNHRACGSIPLFYTHYDQFHLVEDVAKELVGHFLICRESNVVMHIVETEAYREREDIYRNRFLDPPLDFRSRPGRLVSYTNYRFHQHFMFITAGNNDSGDLVLLRTCNVVYGNQEIANRVELIFPATQFEVVNMISGPTKVYKALAPELARDLNLLTSSSGLYLVQKDPNPLVILDRPRILPVDTSKTTYSKMEGANSRFRFAFDCTQRLRLSTKLLRSENQP